MFTPFITSLSQRLYPRKGGGAKGGGAKGGSGTTSKGSGSATGGGKSSKTSVSGSVPGKSKTATAYGGGGGKSTVIPSGQIFAGRTSGGGTRSQVFGTRSYGSGYPGFTGRGVGGLGFPFVFWPVVWGPGFGYGPSYLHNSEYGTPNNSSRPGGPMIEATFTSASANSTFHVLADNTTIISLVSAVTSNCSSLINNGTSSSTNSIPSIFNSSDPLSPRPEQAIQYYRASSVVLTLDGYNDTAILSDSNTTMDTPIPGWVDSKLLDCLNQTIGEAVPLIDGGINVWQAPSVTMLFCLWILFYVTIC